jgi:hypothetical protein
MYLSLQEDYVGERSQKLDGGNYISDEFPCYATWVKNGVTEVGIRRNKYEWGDSSTK